MAMLEYRKRKRTASKIKCEARYYDFVKEAWSSVDPNNYQDGWHIEFICDHLQAVFENKINNLIINIPPGYGKSILTSVLFPAWCWIKNPALRFLTGSKGFDLAVRDCRRSRILFNSKWYQERWGDRWCFVSDENTKGSYENDKGGFRNIFSSQGNVTGFRGDIRIFDDPHDASDTFNSVALQKTNDWFTSTFSTRTDQLKPSKTIIIMQRLAVGDLTGYLLNNYADYWMYVCLPLEYESARKCKTILGEDHRTIEGELLWDKVSIDNISILKSSLGINGVAGQLQQRPNLAEGSIIKLSWFKRYRKCELPRLNYIIISLDSAHKQKEENSYSVITIWGIRDLNIYLLEIWREKAPVYILKRKCVEIYNTYSEYQLGVPVDKLLIEEKSSGISIIQELTHDTMLNILPINPKDSKEVRAHACTPMLEMQRVFLPIDDECPYIHEYLNELAAFPRGDYDDQVDSSTQAWLYIQQKNTFNLANLI
jgi:predicted phage terminase large subunit-like protein